MAGVLLPEFKILAIAMPPFASPASLRLSSLIEIKFSVRAVDIDAGLQEARAVLNELKTDLPDAKIISICR